MNTLTALATVLDLTNAALTLLNKAQAVSAIVAKAQSENRDVTDAEINSVIAEDDVARVALHAEIVKNRGN